MGVQSTPAGGGEGEEGKEGKGGGKEGGTNRGGGPMPHVGMSLVMGRDMGLPSPPVLY